jgi:glutaredoxin
LNHRLNQRSKSIHGELVPFASELKNFWYIIDGDENARQLMVARGSDGKRSVPQIFISDRHIGGCDAIHALDAQGKLDALLAA